MNQLAELAHILGRSPGEAVGPHTVTELMHNSGNPVTEGIWRYAGEGWSAIRKAITRSGEGLDHWRSSENPQHWNYWAREPMAYTSGLTTDAYEGSGITAPTLLGSFNRPDGVALWLEDVGGGAGDRWTVGSVATAAGRLGRAQGSYLAGRRLPDVDWLSRQWLRQYIDSKPVDGSALHDDTLWQLPQVPETFRALRPRLTGLWEDADRLLQSVEALPQTLCHFDVWPQNMVDRPDATVLLDWASVGVGAVGEDAGNLVVDCFWDGFFPLSQLAEVAEGVWKGYLAGLRQAGWSGDERLARLGFTAGGAVKYSWLAEYTLRRLERGELTSYGGYSRLTVEQLFETYAGVFHLLLDWAAQANTLMA